MKSQVKKVVITLIGMVLSANCFAQYKYAGQWSVNAGGGWSHLHGYNIQVGADKVFGTSSHALGLKFFYQRYSDDIGYESKLKYDTYNLHVNYYYSFDRLITSNVFFLNLGGGAVFGYEALPTMITPTVMLHNKSRFVVGLDVSAQLEVALSKNITFFTDPRFVYLFNSDIKKGQFLLGAGIKVYL